MKIVAWNIGHRVREKPLPPNLLVAITALAPDTLILNEFVDGPSRNDFKAGLEGIGLQHIAFTGAVKGHNQVLIASRIPHSAGDLVPPAISSHDGTNFLHRCFSNLEVVGLRVPFYKSSVQLTEYWAALTAITQRTVDRHIVFVGDFNANPANTRKPGGRALASLKAQGWQIPEPEGPWSFISTSGASQSRIDFGVLSPCLEAIGARYIYRAADIVLAGPSSEDPLSDHAPLELRVLSRVSPGDSLHDPLLHRLEAESTEHFGPPAVRAKKTATYLKKLTRQFTEPTITSIALSAGSVIPNSARSSSGSVAVMSRGLAWASNISLGADEKKFLACV